MSAMKKLFSVMADKKASDIFLTVGAPINIKINGVAMPVNQTLLTAEAIKTLLYEVLNEYQIKEYEAEMELNTAYALEGVGAFRISAFRQKGSPAVVVRFIPGNIPPIDTLGLPEWVGRAAMLLAGGALLVCCVVFARRGDDFRSFTAALGATLALSPIVWLHYLVVLLVPMAIARPRFSALWLLPILLWTSPKPGYAEGFQTFPPAIVATILLVVLLARPSPRPGEPVVPAPA